MPRGRVPVFTLCTEWIWAIQVVPFCSLSAGGAQLESHKISAGLFPGLRFRSLIWDLGFRYCVLCLKRPYGARKVIFLDQFIEQRKRHSLARVSARKDSLSLAVHCSRKIVMDLTLRS
jgi:hypothetical protein